MSARVSPLFLRPPVASSNACWPIFQVSTWSQQLVSEVMVCFIDFHGPPFRNAELVSARFLPIPLSFLNYTLTTSSLEICIPTRKHNSPCDGSRGIQHVFASEVDDYVHDDRNRTEIFIKQPNLSFGQG